MHCGGERRSRYAAPSDCCAVGCGGSMGMARVDKKNLEGLADRLPLTFAPPLLAPVTTECPKVSVLIANYNMGRFVVESVRSALSQSYNNFEIIICDDGSEDDSLAQIEASFKNNPKIAYFSQPNAGQAGAMNAAF